MDDVAQLHEGQVLGKDFKVLRPLAAGGMGAVYLAEQLSTGRERAIKVMHPQYVKSADSRARFAQEAKVGAKIRSDHVVEVVSAGVDEATGIPWLAMELLDGEELAKRVAHRRFLPPQEVLEIYRQLCHALADAHRHGLVHRDLKPQNIFLARPRRAGEQFTVKILDFGVAKLVQEQEGELDHTKPVGTPRWMAPEQSDAGATIRPSTDVWALGLIAFYCLTGKCYWRAANTERQNVTALLRELVVEPMVPASARAAELGCGGALPRGFDGWFAGCVERDQSRRLPDAGAALAALETVLDKAPAWKPAGFSEQPDDSATTPQSAGSPPASEGTHRWGAPPPHDDRPLPPLAPPKPLVLPGGSTQSFAQPPPAAKPARARLPYIVAGAIVLAIAIGANFMTRKPKNPALPDSITVVFESFPSGAAVFDGDDKLGTTPMQLSLENAGLEDEPRKFRLVREGFLPYEVVQGPSREPVRVLATLALDPAAAASAAAKAAEEKAAAEREKAAQEKAAQEKVAQEKAAEQKPAEERRRRAPEPPANDAPELRTRR